jgi:hypothetical protein
MLQSHEELDLEDDFVIHAVTIKNPTGGGRRSRKILVDMDKNILAKRCVIKTKDYEGVPCFGVAVFTAKTYIEQRESKNPRRNAKNITPIRMQHAAELLFRKANIDMGAVDATQWDTFQKVLLPEYRLVIVNATDKTGFLFKGDEGKEDLVLLLHDNHYYAVTSLKAWYGYRYFCVECQVSYKKPDTHKCKSKTCIYCEGTHPQNSTPQNKFCITCKGMFASTNCYENHLRSGVCARATICTVCGKWMASENDIHICNSVRCSYCKKSVERSHKCFIQKLPQSKIPATWRYVFFDFECTQNTLDATTGCYKHECDYCVAISVCSNCKGEPCNECLTPNIFMGPNTANDFCTWAVEPSTGNRNATFISQNGSNYDQHFVHDFLVKNGSYPEIVTQGAKIIYMKDLTSCTRWIDSYNFIAIPLAKYPATFGLDGMKKGTFPHLFNTLDNWNYNGELPALEYYNPDNMKEPARSELIKWHKENEHSRYTQYIIIKSFTCYHCHHIIIRRPRNWPTIVIAMFFIIIIFPGTFSLPRPMSRPMRLSG